jgi:hypothetical protein
MEMPLEARIFLQAVLQVSDLVLYGDHEVSCDASKDGEQERVIEAEETKCSKFQLALEQLLGKDSELCHCVLVKVSHQQ